MLNSQRLILRAVEPSDVDMMYEVENDEWAWRYSDTIAPLSRNMLKEYAISYDANPFNSGQLRLIAIEKDSGNAVGIVDLYEISQRHSRAFIGIYIFKKYRNKGLAEETIRLIEKFARESMHLHQLAAKVENNHIKSENLFSKCGYEMKGCLNDWLSLPDGKFTSMKIYTKKLSDYEIKTRVGCKT